MEHLYQALIQHIGEDITREGLKDTLPVQLKHYSFLLRVITKIR